MYHKSLPLVSLLHGECSLVWNRVEFFLALDVETFSHDEIRYPVVIILCRYNDPDLKST